MWTQHIVSLWSTILTGLANTANGENCLHYLSRPSLKKKLVFTRYKFEASDLDYIDRVHATMVGNEKCTEAIMVGANTCEYFFLSFGLFGHILPNFSGEQYQIILI